MDGRSLSAALLTCLCFGSIHAYGVVLEPIEVWLGISRTVASLGYSVALAALTAGVYLSGRLRGLLGLRPLLIACGVLAAGGLVLVAAGHGALGLLIGFGAMFGLANGVAYAVSLDIAATSMPGRAARAMGLATAAYGIGAVVVAQLLAASIRYLPVDTVLLLQAPIILMACIIAAILVRGADLRAAATAHSLMKGRSLLLLWVVYLLGAFAGLMIVAHAPSIMAWHDGMQGGGAGLASGIVSVGSVAGGYLGGIAVERLPGRGSLALPVLLQAAVLALLPLLAGGAAALAALGIAGLCYGILIAAVPGEVRRLAGSDGFAASYGKVFTAWGVAGIGGPVLAGFLFDLTRGYGVALGLAAVLSLLAGTLALVNPPRGM